MSHPGRLIAKRQNGKTSEDPPATACLNIRVIYNDAWVKSAAKGDKDLARCEAKAAMREVSNIFNSKFDFFGYKRFGVAVAFTLVDEGTVYTNNIRLA